MDIRINGKTVSIPEAFQDMTLVHFIRDYLGLKGTKYGCGRGLCGACTVHLDGDAVRSCQQWVSDIGAKAVTTIEGIKEADGTLHPVQRAWVEERVPQCGYCQPGQIMAAVAFLNQQENPTNEDIIQGMDGNLCRCGTYNRIRSAVMRAAQDKSSTRAGPK